MRLFPRSSRFSAGLAALFLFPASLLAWHDGGHMTVAEIAWRKMTPAARLVAQRLVQTGADERTNTFATAACWADDHKTPKDGPWHYRDTFFRADGKKTDLKPDEENAVWALEKFTKMLGDKRASDGDRAQALRFVLHIVGDLHQPLHCVARVTEENPKGDRGGNDFRVLAPENMEPRPRNLHFYWDMAGGLFTKVERPMSAEGQTVIAKWADGAEAIYPLDKHRSAARDLNYDRWTEEGLALCKKQVYDLVPGTVPSPEYQAACQKTAKERIALAGYRLANLLNRLLK
ncbi:MAG: S1/P1 nuclease [Armatimonadetes bacterium]|nr:S1/P1 nuclease [Armatimonadota bacterium]